MSMLIKPIGNQIYSTGGGRCAAKSRDFLEKSAENALADENIVVFYMALTAARAGNVGSWLHLPHPMSRHTVPDLQGIAVRTLRAMNCAS